MTWSRSPELDPRKAYNSARSKATQRGIEWRLTYPEWWQIWRDHWNRKPKEHMALGRYADHGAYERGNCRVITTAENNAEKHHVTKIVTLIAQQLIDYNSFMS
jgi:hypothetical protein